MIRLIEGRNTDRSGAVIEAMHRNRAESFGERHGWDVRVTDGWEVDRFDFRNPLYVVSVDSDANYRGSLRLLPTTGPNMLRDVFPQLLDGGTVESATIWESSRICTRRGAGREALLELIIGIGEASRRAGLTQIVSVFDERMLRILRTILQIDIIGAPQMIGAVMCYAGLFSVDDVILESFKRRFNLRPELLGECR